MPNAKRLACVLALFAVLLVTGCVAQQEQLEETRSMLAQARQQEATLVAQSQGASLTATEANAVQTSLDRTRALVSNLEEQEKILMDQVQKGISDWASVASQVLGGVLGIGALGGRRG